VREIEVKHVRRVAQAYALPGGSDVLHLESWPWPVRVRVLGDFRLELDGQPYDFGRKRPVTLLRLLTLVAGSPGALGHGAVLRALWPASDRESARGSLDTALYRLRQMTAPHVPLTQQGQRVDLDETICWSDARALLHTCDRLAESDLSMAELERLERTLFLLGRERLAPDEVLPALVAARTRIDHAWQQGVVALERAWRMCGEPERADAVRRRAVI